MNALPLLLASSLTAALPAPLARLLASARAQNHQLGISRAQLAEQEAAVSQALAALTPTLQANGSYTRNQYQAVISLPAQSASFFGFSSATTLTIQPYDAWQGGVALNVPVFSAVNLYRHAEAKRTLDAARSSELATDAEVLLSTARAYYQVVGAQGVAQAAERALATAQDNLRVTEAKLEAGTANKLAVDRARVDVASAQETVVTSHQTLALAQRNVETLTGERLSAPLPPPDAPEPSAGSEADFVAQAEQHRPELAQAHAALAQAELSLDEAWGQFVPTVTASAQEHFTNAPGFVTSDAFYSVGASVAWLLDPVGTPAAIRRARAAVAEQRQRLAQQTDVVRDDVHSAWLDVEADRSRLEQALSAAQSAREALDITREQYRAGTATSLDISSAQRDAFNAEATLAQTQANLAAALLALKKAAGEPLLAEGEPAAGRP
ncbi:MAG: TolC family protein [Myxococcales bacterium]